MDALKLNSNTLNLMEITSSSWKVIQAIANPVCVKVWVQLTAITWFRLHDEFVYWVKKRKRTMTSLSFSVNISGLSFSTNKNLTHKMKIKNILASILELFKVLRFLRFLIVTVSHKSNSYFSEIRYWKKSVLLKNLRFAGVV